MSDTGLTVTCDRGWDVLVLASPELEVRILPGKGGDILSIVRRRDGLNLLWSSPWGLRHAGAVPVGSDSSARLMAAYPGGWQSVFPNGGDASAGYGTEWGMHGEVWLAPFAWSADGTDSVVLETRLVLSPFRVVKRIQLVGQSVTVTEDITNEGGHPVATMWSHHPAFGPPFLSGECELECGAKTIQVDDSRRTESGDLLVGAVSAWPLAPAADGSMIDLRTVPPPDAGVDRMAYLTGFTGGQIRLRNPRLDAGIELSWDIEKFPCAWYWLEASGSSGYPWYSAAYVLGLEPASTFPGQGISHAQASGSELVTFAPGQTHRAALTLRVTDAGGGS